MTTAEQLAKETAEKISKSIGDEYEPIILAALNSMIEECAGVAEAREHLLLQALLESVSSYKHQTQIHDLLSEQTYTARAITTSIRALKGGKDG